MKKLILTVVFMVLLTAASQAQTVYKSHNFYGNGVTEYLVHNLKNQTGVGLQDEIYYYTSEKPQKIKMNILSAAENVSGMNGVQTYETTFPKEQSVIYTINVVMGGLIVINPNGSTQEYCIEGFNCGD